MFLLWFWSMFEPYLETPIVPFFGEPFKSSLPVNIHYIEKFKAIYRILFIFLWFLAILGHFGSFLGQNCGPPFSEPLGTLKNWFPISIACHIQSFKWYILLEYDIFMFSYGFGPFWAILGHFGPFLGHMKGLPPLEHQGTLQNWFPKSIEFHIQNFK